MVDRAMEALFAANFAGYSALLHEIHYRIAPLD